MTKKLLFSLFIIMVYTQGFGQKASDSAEVVKTFKTILQLCKNVDFADPKTQELGLFYKVAPYIVYRGDDEKRSWKDAADYTKEEEEKGVNEVCYKINGNVNMDTNYTIQDYKTNLESEGEWHVLTVTYTRKGKPKVSEFAFLRINGRFLLGDID